MVLLCSVLKRCAKCFSAYLCLTWPYLDMACTALTITVMIFTGYYITGNTLDNIRISSTALLLAIHIAHVFSVLPNGFKFEISLTISMNNPHKNIQRKGINNVLIRYFRSPLINKLIHQQINGEIWRKVDQLST